MQPGSSLFFNGWFDPLYLYPSDQQNYIISLNRGVGATRRRTRSSRRPRTGSQVTYQVAVYFKLNTKLLRQFHEQLGLQYRAYTTKGWNNLSSDTFRQQIENAVQEETRQITVADIYGNAKQLVGLQNRVQAKISARLQDALGRAVLLLAAFVRTGKCGDPTFIIKAVSIPKSVGLAFQQQRTSEILVTVKENEVKQAQAEAQSKNALGLSGDQYVLWKAVNTGKTQFWIVPSNGGVTIAPGIGGGSPSSPSTPSTTTTTPKK